MTGIRLLVAILALSLIPALAAACEDVTTGVPRGLAERVALAPQNLSCDLVDRSCRWSFGLGDAVSRALFDTLVETMRACPDFESAIRDSGVNHPDFYDAWAIQIGEQGFSVSIKDKSALQQTFVVLRIMSETRLN